MTFIQIYHADYRLSSVMSGDYRIWTYIQRKSPYNYICQFHHMTYYKILSNVLLRQRVWGHIQHCAIAFTNPCISRLNRKVCLVCNLTVLLFTLLLELHSIQTFHDISAAYTKTLYCSRLTFQIPTVGARGMVPSSVSWFRFEPESSASHSLEDGCF